MKVKLHMALEMQMFNAFLSFLNKISKITKISLSFLFLRCILISTKKKEKLVLSSDNLL